MVPKGWNLLTLEELAHIERGKFSIRPRNDPRYFGGKIPFVQTGDIAAANTFLTKFSQTLNEDGLKVSKLFPKNTILITIAANIGETAITTFDVACPDSIVAIQVREDKAHYFWLKMALEMIKNDLDARATQNAQKNINLQILKPILFKTPPIIEQTKISQILSTWDKAITTTEKLLSNNQQQKKALMQQLLTGNKRFSDYSDEWGNNYLIDIAKVIVSPVDKKSIEGEEHIFLCNYTDVYYNHEITRKLNFMEATATRAEIEKFTLHKGDVVITKDSETPGDIAIPALVAEDLKGVVCGYHLVIIRSKKKLLDGAFLNYLFSMPQTRYYFFSLATGATRFGLSVNGIKKAHFKLPPLEEQQKIALVLSTVDREIEKIKQKLDCLRQEKKALMQQLLTGKRRVYTARDSKFETLRPVILRESRESSTCI